MTYKIPIRDIVETEVKTIVTDEFRQIVKEELSEFKTELFNKLEEPCDIEDVKTMINMVKKVASEDNHVTKDDHHTMNELYDHRTVLFALVCSKFPEMAWKSEKHSDGTSEKGWFIAGLETPYGQITYHQKSLYWNIFHCKELDKAPEYDGHTPGHVLTRLSQLIDYKA